MFVIWAVQPTVLFTSVTLLSCGAPFSKKREKTLILFFSSLKSICFSSNLSIKSKAEKSLWATISAHSTYVLYVLLHWHGGWKSPLSGVWPSMYEIHPSLFSFSIFFLWRRNATELQRGVLLSRWAQGLGLQWLCALRLWCTITAKSIICNRQLCFRVRVQTIKPLVLNTTIQFPLHSTLSFFLVVSIITSSLCSFLSSSPLFSSSSGLPAVLCCPQ